MFTFTFPKRTKYEEERNYFWEKYFQPQLLNRQNWKYIEYSSSFEKIDLIYSPNAKLNKTGSINGNMYHIVDAISDKIKINKQLTDIKSAFVPKMYFFDKFNEMEIKHLLSSTKSFFYLKGATGSTSKSTFIINDYSEIDKIIKANTQIKNWFLSENINSYLYKRKGSYQPNGIVYNEKFGHKGRLKFFILFKIDKTKKEVYLYDQSVYEIAPDEFKNDIYKNDLTSRSQNIIIGMGSEELHGYPKNYDTDPDYGFNPVKIFGNDYFKVILPQLSKMTHDIFQVVNGDLYCKNDKYYNKDFKCCFHFGTVDVIITPELKCYFLEINTKPVMDRPSYESIINYQSMIENIIKICIDPYFPPKLNENNILDGWKRISSTTRGKYTYYVSPTWRLSKDVKKLFAIRKNWEMIIYPNDYTGDINFVGKRKRKNEIIGDPVFSRGILVNKIFTLDHYLGNKKNMYDILSNDPKSFDFLPLTVTFSKNQDYKKIIENAMTKRKLWILKPSVGLRGQDIFVSDNPDKIKSFISQHSNYSEWVLSEYINNPYLLKLHGSSKSGKIFDDRIGRKTHIRVYVLVTKINGNYHIYLYDHTLIFCAVKEYSSDFTDPYSNLTNLYLGNEYYNKLNLNGSLAYRDLSFSLPGILNDLHGPTFYEKKVLPQIKNILRVILLNSKDYLHCANENVKGKRNCFQNIAIDLMPDENWKLYLLEINGKPGMNAPSYHWGNLLNFTNSLLNKTSDLIYKNNLIVNNNVKGFVLVK